MYKFGGSSKTLLFYFSFFDFDDFLTAFAKNLMKRSPIFMTDISSFKLLLSHKDLRSRNFWQWNDGPFNISENLYRNAFSLFVFIKRKNNCNLQFNGTYKMCCRHFFDENWSSFKRSFWNKGPSNMVSYFFRFFIFSCLHGIFAKNFMKKLHFSI